MACPTDCSSCDSSLSVSVSGFTGSCSYLNGSYTFTKSDCGWSGLPDVWGFLACQDGYWKLQIGPGTGGADGEKLDTNGCPALGTYSLNGYGSCNGQSPSASVS